MLKLTVCTEGNGIFDQGRFYVIIFLNGDCFFLRLGAISGERKVYKTQYQIIFGLMFSVKGNTHF